MKLWDRCQTALMRTAEQENGHTCCSGVRPDPAMSIDCDAASDAIEKWVEHVALAAIAHQCCSAVLLRDPT